MFFVKTVYRKKNPLARGLEYGILKEKTWRDT